MTLRNGHVEGDDGKRLRIHPDTWPWLAPEVRNGLQVSALSDIWALACLIVEMMIGSPPASGIEARANKIAAAGVLNPMPPLLSTELRQLHHSCHGLVQRCLQVNPVSRPTAVDLFASDAVRVGRDRNVVQK